MIIYNHSNAGKHSKLGELSMKLNTGNVVWIPCEVKPGAFTNERKVLLSSSFGEWIGFVPVSFLEEPIVEGATNVRATIISVQNGSFSAKIPGEGIGATLYQDLTSKVKAFDTIQT
jgi:hypothetical protein